MRLLLLTIVCLLSMNINALSIKGVVKDGKTGEILIGANVVLNGPTKKSTVSGLDGSFIFTNVREDTVVIECKYMSYQIFANKIVLSSTNQQPICVALYPVEKELNCVEVFGSTRSNDYGARGMERIAPNIMNIVSSQSIELSPDITVGGVLQRISGVVMAQNSTGDGQYAILRGMDKRYNITLVNGVKISSPDNKQRYVPLDIFPSEMLDRLEVTKTRIAETEGDATGGAVNLIMKDAPHQLVLQANVATGYNDQFFDRKFSSFDHKNVLNVSPYEKYGSSYSATMGDFGNAFNTTTENRAKPNLLGGITVGNRFFSKKLGVIIAANYRNLFKGTNSTFFEDEMLQTEDAVRLTSMKERSYTEEQTQYGIHAKLDFRITPSHKLEFYNAYINLENSQVRQSNSTNFKLNYDPQNGNGDFAYQTRLRLTKQQILSSTLRGLHDFGKSLKVNWSLVYSDAKKNVPDLVSVNLDNLRQNFVNNIYADADGSTRRWEHNTDHDYSGYLNAQYNIVPTWGKITLNTGGMFRKKQRDNFYVSYTFKPIDNQQYGVDFNDISEIKWKLYTPKGSVGPLTYNASENIVSGYLQSKFNYKNLEIITGVRLENTNQGYLMFYPNSGDKPDGNQQYTDILPNIQLKYSYVPQANVRLSYYRSINRPGFFEIVPYQMNYEEYTEYGNKNLKHAVIDNFDARWELYPKQEEQVLIGLFYKNINSPIEYAYYSVNQRQYGYGPANLGNAKNYGVEIDYIKYIRKFGIKANYTFTHSAITTSKVIYTKDGNGNTKTSFVNQTRPLVGQSAHVANLALLFKSVKSGWNAQLSSVYMGDRIVIASRFLDSDYWQKGSIQLDFSAEKKFKNGISLFCKANNLLNTPLIEFIKSFNSYNQDFPMQSKVGNGETLIRKDFFNRTFLLGIRYNL